ncbi:hypothetical protein C9374_009477 [Naegleria lovaniensis]|uniref:VWFA domain-containing protein n=1 Tax=Naegleria lovaniensis TaxID=51637 RepID=A0AA88GXN5_NAELO|nr:uncharacterized protein C9374_009477 [Naegleria lovaniensis]KAG2392900.1 hypothetical protein C9374_009477 [Naegleria lovaniensis]
MFPPVPVTLQHLFKQTSPSERVFPYYKKRCVMSTTTRTTLFVLLVACFACSLHVSATPTTTKRSTTSNGLFQQLARLSDQEIEQIVKQVLSKLRSHTTSHRKKMMNMYTTTEIAPMSDSETRSEINVAAYPCPSSGASFMSYEDFNKMLNFIAPASVGRAKFDKIVSFMLSQAYSYPLTGDQAEIISYLDRFSKEEKERGLVKLINTVFKNKNIYESDKSDITYHFDRTQMYDCAFGQVMADDVVFAVDFGPAMSTQISSTSSSTGRVTRLDFALQHLARTLSTLKETQKFDVVCFCGDAHPIFGKTVYATTANIHTALDYLSYSQVVSSYTSQCKNSNIEMGIKKSVSSLTPIPELIRKTNSIHLISSGVATIGETYGASLGSIALELLKGYKASVNTFALTLGGNAKTYLELKARDGGAETLNTISYYTNGVYKRIQ